MRLTDQQEAFLADPEAHKGWLYDNGTPARRDGRTMALAHQALRKAWATPGEWVELRDHFPARDAHRNLLDVVHGLAHHSRVALCMDFRAHPIPAIRVSAPTMMLKV